MGIDPTIFAGPGFIGSMFVEQRWLSKRADDPQLAAAQYERHDATANIALALGSVAAPLVFSLVRPHLDARTGKAGRALLKVAAAAAATATVGDAVARTLRRRQIVDLRDSARTSPVAVPTNATATNVERLAGAAAATAIGAGIVVASATWSGRTTAERLWRHRRVDLGTGVAAWALAIVGFDFIYYWNHRLQHETRFMWAIHVVHHNSERYNLSVALRQAVLDALGIFVPTGVLAVAGVRPRIIELSRSINLIYQFWVHTEAIDTMGAFEKPMNTPSHHRVHHGVNPHYIDRNHGGIFIVWDKLFGTFQAEDVHPTYGITKNLGTFSLPVIVFREYCDIARDVVAAHGWRERLGFVFRGPGWAYRQRGGKATISAV
ncbi:MAG: sterol desaturase family protein [Actinobacteria bacterium]|nr:sterol desaturase family protein [Actinomycetota bacterium]